MAGLASGADSPDLDATRKLFIGGQYQACARLAERAIQDGEYREDWRLLLLESQFALGQYTNALEVLRSALNRYTSSIRLRLLAYDIYQFNNQPQRAQSMLDQINVLAQGRMWAYRDPVNLVALGRAALLLGADPRHVLEQYFDQAKRQDATAREVHLASGQLALAKNDPQLAAKVFTEGLKVLPDDPDLHFGLASAFASSNRRQMLASTEATLQRNTNHAACYLLLADHLIDGEKYTDALETLDQVLAVNPWHPEAWAYRAVIAHLQSDFPEESRCRAQALAFWTNNPAVDHLMGRKLSQKYRFTEGAKRQRQALAFDSDYLPAKMQLAQDTLRLGHVAEGWELARQVHEQDGYNAAAFNLVNLHDVMDTFATLTNDHFIIRMSRKEASLYGDRTLALLERARETLCAKYAFTLDQPVTVEIFPEQKDFGVRTFGMPDNPGYLGVCFGAVITANSPASRAGSPNNWEAVLWHEFCHVITLQITRNRMPRWLSEGISVYEERQANPTWGQIMNPRYRRMILEGELTPVGELSAAFLAPRSEVYLQFAYFESYLVVDFLVRRYGLEVLRNILTDLGEGQPMNTTLTRHTTPLDELEEDFAAFAKQQAEALGPGLEWDAPDPKELAEAKPEWLAQNALNYHVLLYRAQALLADKQYEEAKAPLQALLERYPDQRGQDNAYALLAQAHRGLCETNQEREILTRLALLDADALDAFGRLIEIEQARTNWTALQQNAERFLAVNPLTPQPYRALADAAQALDRIPDAIQACRQLLQLDVPDPAQVHFQLARLLHKQGDPAARRHVLEALEDAPRFREAHRLLLELHEQNPVPPAEPVPVSSPSPPPRPGTPKPAYE